MLLLLSDVLTNFKQISNNCFLTIILKKYFLLKKKSKILKKNVKKLENK